MRAHVPEVGNPKNPLAYRATPCELYRGATKVYRGSEFTYHLQGAVPAPRRREPANRASIPEVSMVAPPRPQAAGECNGQSLLKRRLRSRKVDVSNGERRKESCD